MDSIYDEVEREARDDWNNQFGHLTPRQRFMEEHDLDPSDLREETRDEDRDR